MHTPEDFFAEAETYIKLFDAFAEKHTLQGKASADHICYKCGSAETFEKIRSMFENESEYLYQSIISKRRIAIIRFKDGIQTLLGTINFLELSDQKPDGSQHDGFDHIEAFPIGWTYDTMVDALKTTETVVHIERPHHTTDDIDIGNGFLFRCTHGPLVEKIKKLEML